MHPLGYESGNGEETGTGCAAGANFTSADSAGPGAFIKELCKTSACSSSGRNWLKSPKPQQK